MYTILYYIFQLVRENNEQGLDRYNHGYNWVSMPHKGITNLDKEKSM